MSGTKSGAAKAVATIERKYGKEYWATVGHMGGRVKGPKGFSLNRELASTAGRAGGLAGRGKTKRQPKRKPRRIYHESDMWDITPIPYNPEPTPVKKPWWRRWFK